jgi:hypothetical protein
LYHQSPSKQRVGDEQDEKSFDWWLTLTSYISPGWKNHGDSFISSTKIGVPIMNITL